MVWGNWTEQGENPTNDRHVRKMKEAVGLGGFVTGHGVGLARTGGDEAIPNTKRWAIA